MNWRLLEELSNTPGVPGYEDRVREIILRELGDRAEDIKVDTMGNLIMKMGGVGPKLLIDAHMDEVGFMVSKVEENGFVRVIPLGGIDPRNAYSQRVVIWGKEPVYGVFGSTPPHLKTEKKEVPPVEDLFIDTGLSTERLRELVKVGDPVTFDTQCVETEETLMGKAFDDRVGVFVMIEAFKRAKKLGAEVYLVGAVEEEGGLRGAKTASYFVKPDLAIALEGTVANDVPGTPSHRILARVGGGPEIRLSDGKFIASRRWVEFISSLASERGIKHQIIAKRVGGTDAAIIQLAHEGVHATAISVPVRYIHSACSLVRKEDVENTVKLVALIIEEASSFVCEE